MGSDKIRKTSQMEKEGLKGAEGLWKAEMGEWQGRHLKQEIVNKTQRKECGTACLESKQVTLR